jgi:hypothetical protein
MKKTKLWVLLVFALAMGMVFGACDTGTGGGDNDGGDNTGKKLVITNVSGTIVREYISVFISRDAAIEDIVAYGDHFVVEGTTISTNDLYEASYDDGPEKVWTVVPGNY